MRQLVASVIVLGALSLPALAQAPPSSSSQDQYQPGEGGRSKPGLPGEPGNKSGPAVEPSGSGAATGERGAAAMPGHDGAPNERAAAGSDEAKVPGKPGNKSGLAAQPPK